MAGSEFNTREKVAAPLTLGAYLAVLVALAVLGHLALLLNLPLVLQTLAVFVIGGFVPGALFTELLLGESDAPPDVWERLLYAIGAGYTLMALSMLALSYLPGGVDAWQTYLLFNGLALILLGLIWLRARRRHGLRTPLAIGNPFPAIPVDRSWLLAGIVVLLLLAGFLRFTNLGYSEFHGDEARAALRAAAILQGYDDVLFLHKKGPGEILIPTAILSLTGHLGEDMGRLLFGVASIAAMFAVWRLGWRMLSPLAGWLAALLFAMDGYFVAFARFLQYQSVVLLMAVLVVLIFYRLVKYTRATTPYLTLAGLFFATGLLFHYDALAMLAPALFMLVLLFVQPQVPRGALVRSTLIAAGVSIGCVLAFYAPFTSHPHFRATFAYLSEQRVVGDASFPYNNLYDFFVRGSFYSSGYYMVFLCTMLTISAIVVYRRGYGRIRGALFSVALVALLAITLWRFNWLAIGARDFVVIPFAIALLLIWFAPKLSMAERILWFWFGTAAILGLFFTLDPRTHIHIIYTPWLLLVGGVVAQGWQWLAARRGRTTATAVGLVVTTVAAVIFGYYIYWYYVQTDVEVLRDWEQNHPDAYWTPFDQMDVRGLYGFPIAHGWRTVGSLLEEGVFNGHYEADRWFNWESSWYARGRDRCRSTADWLFTIEGAGPWTYDWAHVQGVIESQGFGKWGVIEKDGVLHMTIYHRGDEVAEDDLQSFEIGEFQKTFAQYATPDLRVTYPVVEDTPGNPLHVNFGDQIWLEGYDIEYTEPLTPGDTFRLKLYWRGQQTLFDAYKVFNQAYDGDGVKAAQKDAEPVCDLMPTFDWPPGELITDIYDIEVFADAPAGTYPIYSGLYHKETQERLPVLDEQGVPIDNQVRITEIVVDAR